MDDATSEAVQELRKYDDPRMKEKFHLEVAMKMLEEGADVNMRDDEGNTVLHFACLLADWQCLVDELLAKGAKVDATNDAGVTVLMAACSGPKAADVLKSIISTAPNVTTKYEWCASALRFLTAKKTSNIPATKVVLDFGFPVDDEIFAGSNILHCAIRTNKLDLVEWLVDYGADITKKTADGVTPLYEAACLKSSAISAFLIKKGAKIDARNDIDRRQPIHAAAAYHSVENLILLLSLGADVNATT